MNVRCPVCGSAVRLAVGDTQLACTACGLAAPISGIGTAPGAPSAQLVLETDLTGTTIAGKQLVERIGAGGMGTVYRARAADSDVAIKVLRPGLGAERAAMLARFAREAEAMRRLAHPRVVRFLDHGEDGDAAFIVTELVEGQDLAARLAAGRMTLAEIVDVFGQVCDGVAAAHAAGIVHRDLKPANILVGTDGVKVADFGLAQLGADVAIPTLTRTNVAMGTFHYLAPEQRKDAKSVDHRADIWALGVIFYEMFTGELPLGSFASPSALGPPGCDRRVDAIVRRALAPDPAARYANASELARDVRALVAPRRVAKLAIAAAALALAGGSTMIAFAMRSDDKPAVANAPSPPVIVDAAIAQLPDAAIDAPPDATEIAVAPPPLRASETALPPDGDKTIKSPPVKPALAKPGPVKTKKTGAGKVPVGKPASKTKLGKKFGGGKGKVEEPLSKDEDGEAPEVKKRPTAGSGSGK
jgi:hypothetical protein